MGSKGLLATATGTGTERMASFTVPRITDVLLLWDLRTTWKLIGARVYICTMIDLYEISNETRGKPHYGRAYDAPKPHEIKHVDEYVIGRRIQETVGGGVTTLQTTEPRSAAARATAKVNMC